LLDQNALPIIGSLNSGTTAYLLADLYADEAVPILAMTLAMPGGVALGDSTAPILKPLPGLIDLTPHIKQEQKTDAGVALTLTDVPKGYSRLLLPVRMVSPGHYSWPASQARALDGSGRYGTSRAATFVIKSNPADGR
jgi:hypothetical protein